MTTSDDVLNTILKRAFLHCTGITEPILEAKVNELTSYAYNFKVKEIMFDPDGRIIYDVLSEDKTFHIMFEERNRVITCVMILEGEL